MRSRAGRLAIAVLGVLVFVLFVVPTTIAQEKSLRWRRWDSDTQINRDGTFTVCM